MGGFLDPSEYLGHSLFNDDMPSSFAEQVRITAMRQQLSSQCNAIQSVSVQQRLLTNINEVARLQSMLEAYKTCEIPTPPEISKAYKKAIADAKAAYREQKEQELAAARKQLEELKSREQKRDEVAKRIQELEEELG